MTPLPPTFWAKVEAAGDHWLWIGAIGTRGYGSFAIHGVSHLAHRLAYESVHGPIPQGLVIDHVCRVRPCVNPDHMEPVSIAVNSQRGKDAITHCPHGHCYTTTNTRINGQGHRSCKTCAGISRDNFRRSDLEALLTVGSDKAAS